jgi:ribosomal-protein-alanine N-acetyltransferase
MDANFETKRLNVSPLTTNDIDFIAELVNSDGWLKYIGDRNVHNRAQALEYIQKILVRPFCFYNVIRLKEKGAPIGIISFIKRESQKYYDIGFALLPNHEGKGYILEAASKYLELIARTNQHEKIIAITLRDNTKSISLLEKLGLTFVEDYRENGEELRIFSMWLNQS